jgi:hypothetical protein
MIAFDLAYELSLGSACALLDVGVLRRPGDPGRESEIPNKNGAFHDGLRVSALVYIPLCAAGFSAWPGWQSMYLADLRSIPFGEPAFAALSTAALFACYLAGYRGASALLRPDADAGRRRARSLLAAIGLAWIAVLFVLFGLLRRRALSVTTFEAFQAGRPLELGWGAPEALLGGPVMAFLAASAALNAGGLVWLFARARRRALT